MEVANFTIRLIIYFFALPLKQPARYMSQGQWSFLLNGTVNKKSSVLATRRQL